MDLVIATLNDKSKKVREASLFILNESSPELVEKAFYNYLPFNRIKNLHTIVGNSERPPNYFSICLDGNILVSNCYSRDWKGYAYEEIKIWSLSTGKLITNLYLAHEHMSISHKKEIIATHFQHIIDLSGNFERYGYKQLDQISEDRDKTNSDIGSIVVSDDGNIVACGELGNITEGLITIWNINTGKLIYSLQWKPYSKNTRINSLLIAPDSLILLSVIDKFSQYFSRDLHRLWDLRTGELIRTYETSNYWMADSIAITPDKNYLACGIRNNVLKVWNLITDKVIYDLGGNSPSIMTPDGRVLICADRNNILIYDLLTQEKICTLEGHKYKITHIALSPDRETIASYSIDGTIKIWGISEGI